MATKKTKKAKISKEETSPTFDIRNMLTSTIDDIEKRQGRDTSGLDISPTMSTGNLCLDLVYGGGIKPAMVTHFGQEQSAKTTGALTIMASAIKHDIPVISWFDYEGSTRSSKPYIQSILKDAGIKAKIDEVFGRKDDKGNWIHTPLVRYSAEAILERFYDYVSEVLRQLPDKRYINKQWWLVYEDTKQNKAKLDEYAHSGMNKKYGKGIWIPAENGNLQAIFFVDSYPAMNPESADDESVSNALAVAARAFSKHLPRVKGRLISKMCAIVGINQLRAIPMAMFGPKENEPGGNALKLFSDVRIRFTSRALSGAPLNPKSGKKSSLEEESSVEGDGNDIYRYINIVGAKNKLNIPGRSSWLRIWVTDTNGEARGLCPVFDTIYYLQQTGQLTGQRKGFTLVLDNLGKASKPIPWQILKKWILFNNKEVNTKICQALGYKKSFNIRDFCFKQMESGIAEKLYAEHNVGKSKSSKDDDDDYDVDNDE